MNLAGLSLSLSTPRGGSSGPATIAAPFASVNGPLSGPSAGPYESWSVEYGSQPTLSANVAFTVSRQGYTAAAATTTYLDTMYVVKTTSAGGAVRQPYPNQASQSATTAALSDYIYSTDTPSGSVTNNSTFISPKPVANWATPDRRLVGDTIGGDTMPVEVVAFHRNARNGKQVACVVFTITDSAAKSTTVTVSTPEVSTYPGDVGKVIVYKLPATTISDAAGWATGTITVNAAVYPWIGAAASVADSSSGSPTRREFGPRYFQKNTAKLATPDIMYVKTTGNDATAQVNNASLPALTIVGAINRMRTGSTGAPWNTGTTKIVVADDGTFVAGATGSGASTGQIGGLTITRDTATTTRAGVVLQLGVGSCNPNMTTAAGPGTACLIFTDVSMIRSGGTLNPFRGADTDFQLDQVSFDGSALTSNWFSTSSTGQGCWLYGVALSNYSTGGSWGTITQVRHCTWRGVTAGSNTGPVETWLMLGCSFTAGSMTTVGATGLTQDGMIMAFNRFSGITNSMFNISTAITNGIAVVQNIFEYTGTTTTQFQSMSVSNDGATNNTTNVIIHGNTFAGWYEAGRNNLFYDETTGTNRTNILQSMKGNILVAPYTKGDVFKTDGTKIGNWGFLYGAGCEGNFTQNRSNSALGGDQAQAYEGISSNYGTAVLTRNDPLFTTNGGTTTATGGAPYSAGAGSGVYTVSSSSPAKNLLTSEVLSHDYAGTARVNKTAGAYDAP